MRIYPGRIEYKQPFQIIHSCIPHFDLHEAQRLHSAVRPFGASAGVSC